jgi:hypothetical protein
MKDLREAQGRSIGQEAMRRGLDPNQLIDMETGVIKPIPAPESGIQGPP